MDNSKPALNYTVFNLRQDSKKKQVIQDPIFYLWWRLTPSPLSI